MSSDPVQVGEYVLIFLVNCSVSFYYFLYQALS